MFKCSENFIKRLYRIANSKNISTFTLIDLIKNSNNKNKVFTENDLKIFAQSSEDEPTAKKYMTEIPLSYSIESPYEEPSQLEGINSKVRSFLSNYISSIDLNITDQEVATIYDLLLNEAVNAGYVDLNIMKRITDGIIEDHKKDLSLLSDEEIQRILELHQDTPLVQNWPGQEQVDIFSPYEKEKRDSGKVIIPLSLK